MYIYICTSPTFFFYHLNNNNKKCKFKLQSEVTPFICVGVTTGSGNNISDPVWTSMRQAKSIRAVFGQSRKIGTYFSQY